MKRVVRNTARVPVQVAGLVFPPRRGKEVEIDGDTEKILKADDRLEVAKPSKGDDG